MSYLSLSKIDIKNKIVVLRTDLNVPLQNGVISDDTRILAALPTMQKILDAGAGLIILSHLGRPTEGEFDKNFSLACVAEKVSTLLNKKVRLEKDPFSKFDIIPGQVVMLENVRFNPGEKENAALLSKAYAKLGDVFVMDAFASAHRKQASTYGAILEAQIACAGPLLNHELSSINKAIALPGKPVLAIVGGAKVSTKLKLLRNLLNIVDVLITGGGIANTLLKAAGHNVGASLVEDDQLDIATEILKTASEKNISMPLPTDVIVAENFSADAASHCCSVDEIKSNAMILDAGPETIAAYEKYILAAGTILWNGPLGVFEWDNFAGGTQKIGTMVAQSQAYSLAGGGDTLAAINKFAISGIDFCSTGGGAFLECLEGETLPAISALEQRAKEA